MEEVSASPYWWRQSAFSMDGLWNFGKARETKSETLPRNGDEPF